MAMCGESFEDEFTDIASSNEYDQTSYGLVNLIQEVLEIFGQYKSKI